MIEREYYSLEAAAKKISCNDIYYFIHLGAIGKVILYWKVHDYQIISHELVHGIQIGNGWKGRQYGLIRLPMDFLNDVEAKKELAELHIFESSRRVIEGKLDGTSHLKSGQPSYPFGVTFSEPVEFTYMDVSGNLRTSISQPIPSYPQGTEVVTLTQLIPSVTFGNMQIMVMAEDLKRLQQQPEPQIPDSTVSQPTPPKIKANKRKRGKTQITVFLTELCEKIDIEKLNAESLVRSIKEEEGKPNCPVKKYHGFYREVAVEWKPGTGSKKGSWGKKSFYNIVTKFKQNHPS